MSTLCISYPEFALLCERLLGGSEDAPQRIPRPAPPEPGARRYRGRWAHAAARCRSGRLALRRAAGAPRGLRLT